MESDEEDKKVGNELKRPAISNYTYTRIKAIADSNMAISADDVGWEKCLEVVIDEYVPGHEDEQPHNVKDYVYD
jgi:hypothetical protein